MFRSITRILMIIVACAALVALAATAKAKISSASPIAWMTSDSGPLALASKLTSGDPTATPEVTQSAQNAQNGQSAQDAANDNDSGPDASGPEDLQENDQQSEQAQELEVSGAVASVDSANSAFTLTTASGSVTVQVSGATQYDDGLNGLASLQSSMSVTVKGTAPSAGQMLATEVKGSSGATGSNGADTSSPDNGN
ncbi:MAG TPA: DUF5666 domain-containing protein [Ktedonobacterales bacterium]|jgi:threonine dehydrogenase-like Zn-dependent dehydrogenase|nr:DUF5666 domain-containing protein [Ktedonobacterales bacterium]